MKVCVVSEENFLSEFIAKNANGNGVTVTRINAANSESVNKILPEYDYVILNHRTSLNRRILEGINDKTRIVDLSVAKTPMLRYKGEIISMALLNCISNDIDKTEYELSIIKDVSTENAAGVASQIFPNVVLVERTAEEHDRLMSEILVKPYILSLLTRKVTNLDQVPRTGEYEMALELSRYVTNYNVDHIRDLLRNNPFTPEIFAKMEENLKRVWNELSLY